MTCDMWKLMALSSIGLWFVTILYNYRPDLKKPQKPPVRAEDLGNVIGMGLDKEDL